MRGRTLLAGLGHPFVLALSSLLAVGCEPNYSRTPPPPERYAIPENDEQVAAVAISFDNYDPIAAAVAECQGIKLYEGLPHQSHEQALYDRELSERKTVNLNGWPFYEQPIQPSEHHAKRLKEIFCDQTYFVPFGGFKLCGGYHPDWCIVWSSEGRDYLVQFCFGCDEMKATDGESEVYCDVWDIREIKWILNKYRSRRPRNL